MDEDISEAILNWNQVNVIKKLPATEDARSQKSPYSKDVRSQKSLAPKDIRSQDLPAPEDARTTPVRQKKIKSTRSSLLNQPAPTGLSKPKNCPIITSRMKNWNREETLPVPY